MKKAKFYYNNEEDEFFDSELGQKVYKVAPACWISQDQKDLNDARNKAAAALGKYFELKRERKSEPKMCACLGIGCGDYSCPALWRIFLQGYDDKLLEFVWGLR